ncbi:MAG: hypothetical protein QXZ63_06680 [Sulfolobales archaeon]
MGKVLVYVVLVVVFAGLLTPVAHSSGVGYLGIQDYTGRTWSYSDVLTLLNTSVGSGTLADYLIIMVDGTDGTRYGLRNFVASPLDGRTAVLPLPAGQHVVEIKWFGYTQKQIINVAPAEHTVIKLNTAPVVPFTIVTTPEGIYDWDVAYNPSGLTFMRRDGNAWVRLNYQSTVITVAVYGSNGWEYRNISIVFNYVYTPTSFFNIRDPRTPNYTASNSGCFLFFCWDLYRRYEYFKYNRTGNILHGVYTIAVSENEGVFGGIMRFLGASSNTIDIDLSKFLSSTMLTLDTSRLVDKVKGTYDMLMGLLFASKYQKTVIIIWDFFMTPTQILILGHVYRLNENGNLVPLTVTSTDVFSYGNRVAYNRVLSGMIEWYEYRYNEQYVITASFPYAGGQYNKTLRQGTQWVVNTNNCYDDPNCGITFPGGIWYTFYLDDISRYSYEFLYTFADKWEKYPATGWNDFLMRFIQVINFTFDDLSKAQLFAQRLLENNVSHRRSGNTVTLILSDTGSRQPGLNMWERKVYYHVVPPSILNMIPSNSSGYVRFGIQGWICFINDGFGGGNDWVKYYIADFAMRFVVYPRMDIPDITLLTNGFVKVGPTTALRVYTTTFREDNSTYVLGYYLFGGQPPPVYVVRDVYYDFENDIVHYVYTLVSVDAYGKTLIKYNKTVQSSATSWYVQYYGWFRPIDATISLYDYSRMSFLNLAPEVIKPLIVVNPNLVGGAGTVIVDWSTVQTIVVNVASELYYLNGSRWVPVSVEYDNESMTYLICINGTNVLLETLKPGNVSTNYYKLVAGTEVKGFLYNDNGVLKMLAGNVYRSLSDAEIAEILERVRLHDMYEMWLRVWGGGLLYALSEWWSRNKLLILAGVGAFMAFIVMLALMSRPKIVVAGLRR